MKTSYPVVWNTFFLNLATIKCLYFQRQYFKENPFSLAPFVGIIFCTGIIGSLSIASGLIVSPVTITLCRRKSTRLLAVIGGLVLTLGCLFTSFAQQFHQVLFSYGKILKTL